MLRRGRRAPHIMEPEKGGSMRFDRGQRERFDEVAPLYDRVRPGYPDELIEEMIRVAGTPAEGDVLEIGCGTGQLTKALAARGFRVTAIELGEHLAHIAAENLRRFSNVRIVRAAFESWESERSRFDLVCSAQAFHWIDPEIGYTKVRDLLRPHGRLALLWNLFSGGSGPTYRALDRVYRERAPEIAELRNRDSLTARVERTSAAIIGSGLFEAPILRRHPWTASYTAAEYTMLLRTFSDHRALPASELETLIAGVRETIVAHGGTIDRPQVATLFLSRPLG